MYLCLTIMYNVVSKGYPFLESVASVLPVCRNLVIVDGGSIDGTLELAERISRINKKIKVVKDRWESFGDLAKEIREFTNKAINRFKGEKGFLLYLQASEVVHEESLSYLEELPEIYNYRYRIFFSIPFRLVIGPYYNLGDEFRGRIAYNLYYYKAIEDAFTLGIPLKEILRNFSRFAPDLFNLRRVLSNLIRGINSRYGYAYSSFAGPAYLPKPVFHYIGLMPEDFIRKYLERAEKYWGNRDTEILRTSIELIKKSECPNTKEIWEKLVEAFIRYLSESIRRAGHEKIYLKNLARLGAPQRNDGKALEIKIEEHPKIMQELIRCKCCKKYFIREHIIENLKDL